MLSQFCIGYRERRLIYKSFVNMHWELVTLTLVGIQHFIDKGEAGVGPMTNIRSEACPFSASSSLYLHCSSDFFDFC